MRNAILCFTDDSDPLPANYAIRVEETLTVPIFKALLVGRYLKNLREPKRGILDVKGLTSQKMHQAGKSLAFEGQ